MFSICSRQILISNDEVVSKIISAKKEINANLEQYKNPSINPHLLNENPDEENSIDLIAMMKTEIYRRNLKFLIVLNLYFARIKDIAQSKMQTGRINLFSVKTKLQNVNIKISFMNAGSL